jgi:ribosomal protein S18 acetylase RimI-like enzyme
MATRGLSRFGHLAVKQSNRKQPRRSTRSNEFPQTNSDKVVFMNTPCTIRAATLQDLAAIWQIYAAALGAHAQRKDEYWRGLIAADGMIVAEAENNIVGFGGIDVAAREQIQYVYVAPAFQQHGIGGQILARLEAIGWQNGLLEVQLHADPQAVIFYARAGYQPIASDLHHDHDGVAMRKRLA